jgi:hypothetical protein
MKRLMLVALLATLGGSNTRAQESSSAPAPANLNVAADFANTSAATPTTSERPFGAHRPANVSAFPEPGAPAGPAKAAPASPEPPEPKFVYGDRDDSRWQFALGITLVRFRSPLYYATGVGTNLSVTYFTNEWFGVEGNVNTAFAPTINQNQHVKYASYGAGPKIAWRARKWEPWAHAIAGGMHVLPQTAGHSQNGLAFQAGGGVDYRFNAFVSARVEVDWVKTHVFGAWGNSAQANADIVLHF